MSLFTVLLFASTALAAAVPAAHAPAPTGIAKLEHATPVALEKRAGSSTTMWAPSGTPGTFTADYSDETIMIGCSPDTIMDSVVDACGDSGFCEPTWDLQCPNTASGTDTITITKSEGQYSKDSHQPLLDTLRAGLKFKGVVTSKDIPKLMAPGSFVPPPGGPVTYYTMPSFVGLSSRTGTSDVPDVISFTVSVKGSSTGKNACSALTEIAGDIAGAMNEVLGEAASLAGMLCDFLE